MNYKIKNTDESLSCSIGYDRKTWFRSQVPCAYDTETAAYAACRLIRHLPPVRDRLIAEAVGLGLGSPTSIPVYESDFIFAVLCEQFGLTPASRSRIVADTGSRDPADEMEDILNG